MIKILLPLVLLTLFPKSILLLIITLTTMLVLSSLPLINFKLLLSSHGSLSWDILSITLISLTIFISLLILIARLPNTQILKFKTLFISTLNSLILCLVGVFSVTNLIIFYIIFEASLIPTFVIILGWGNQPERIQAGIYIFIYTLLASLPLLITLLIWTNSDGRARFLSISIIYSTGLLPKFTALLLIIAFSIKLPLFIVHLWLPKAHVEAPVAGSIILAAILLKLGGYGILRVASRAHFIYYLISPFLLRWSIVGGVLVAFICLFQTDIKFLVALSSVAHIAIVIARVLTFSSWGINGAQFIIIGHGFCSSGLFFLANSIYERIRSRRLYLLKGLQTFIPPITLIWFILCTSNIAAPPSLNLLGERMSISSILPWAYLLFLPLILLTFLAAAYSLFLYRQTQHGKPFSPNQPYSPATIREWLIAISHWLPLNLIILTPWITQIAISDYNLYKILSCGLK